MVKDCIKHTNKINTKNIDTKVHSAHTQSCLLVLTTMNVSTTSAPYISDMYAAKLPNASQMYLKRSEMLYLVMFCLNTDLGELV